MLDLLPGIRRADLPQWIGRLRSAGIWADRFSSPDFTAQLHQTLRRPVDTVLCSLLDDPVSGINAVVGAQYGVTAVAGVALLANLTGANRVWVAVDAAAPQRWWKLMRRLGRRQGVQVFGLRNDYPQSDPTLMLYTLFNRRLRPGRLPIEQGVMMIDAALAVALGRYLANSRPMLRVPLVVHDHVRRQAHFVLSPAGMTLRDALGQLGIVADGLSLRGGNLLRDCPIDLDAIIGGGELAVHLSAPEAATNPDPCIRCAWCIEGCPTRVQPAALLEAAQRQDLAMAEQYGLPACIECGVCSYVCPSRLPLLESIRRLRYGHA